MKIVSLISGGIDSPVASYLMLEKGFEIVFVHFDLSPYGHENTEEKTLKLVKKLAKKFKKEFKYYKVPQGEVVHTHIREKCDSKKLCVLCRRFMYRISEKIAENEKAAALLTGENLGQVASQTLDNLAVENQSIKIPVLRPLIGLDKEDIVNLARENGTFSTSILPGGCCCFIPKYPETRAELEVIKTEEKKLDVAKLVKKALENAEVIKVK